MLRLFRAVASKRVYLTYAVTGKEQRRSDQTSTRRDYILYGGGGVVRRTSNSEGAALRSRLSLLLDRAPDPVRPASSFTARVSAAAAASKSRSCELSRLSSRPGGWKASVVDSDDRMRCVLPDDGNALSGTASHEAPSWSACLVGGADGISV